MDTEHATQELPQREEWMLLTELVPGSLNAIDESHETLHTTCNWQNDRLKFKDSQIREMSSWLRMHKQAFTPRTITDQNIDVSTFSDMKKRGYNVIKAQSEQPYPKDALLLIIVGGGGTGKSYLINAINALLKQSRLHLAYTEVLYIQC